MQRYSSFLKRFVALTIDLFVVIFTVSFVEFLTGVLTGILPYILIFFMSWAYFVFQESSSRKGTIGKQAMNLIVTDLKGNRISLIQATKRFFGRFIAAIPFFAGFFLIYFTSKKQTFYDIIAKTVVFICED